MPLNEFTGKGESNAWNYLSHLFDLGSSGCYAALVSQPRLGLCPDGGHRSCSPHRYSACATRPNLGFDQVEVDSAIVISGQRSPAALVMLHESVQRALLSAMVCF